MFFDSKNGNQNNADENNISKSLSRIEQDNSNNDNNEISISDSNDIFNYPSPKKMLSEMNQLSKRIRENEYENEFNNRTRVEELRTKYIPTLKRFDNDSINKKTPYKITNKINKRFNQINIHLNKNKIIDKKILKPNMNINSINQFLKTDGNNDKKVKAFDFSTKNKFFTELLNEDCNYVNNIKKISKKDLLSNNIDNEKIIILLDKNREIMNLISKIEDRYKTLRNEYIFLYKNINNISICNSNLINSKNEYENYISKENINLNKKLQSYESIFTSMTNYINDISKIFNLTQINFIEIKQNIINANIKSDEIISNFVDILKENINYIAEYIKERIKFKNNNLSFKTKYLVKKKYQ